jgi:hypothetical protein
MPLLGEGLQHLCEQPDKFHNGARGGQAAFAPQHEDVVGAQMPSPRASQSARRNVFLLARMICGRTHCTAESSAAEAIKVKPAHRLASIACCSCRKNLLHVLRGGSWKNPCVEGQNSGMCDSSMLMCTIGLVGGHHASKKFSHCQHAAALFLKQQAPKMVP